MEYTCPSCKVSLQAQPLPDIGVWKCLSCSGLAISLPVVRKGLNPETFRDFWKKLYSGRTASGRPCPACEKPLSEVEAAGKGGAILIDVCRPCHLLWFDDQEFAVLPKAQQSKVEANELMTKEDRAYAAFKAEQFKRRSFLMKLLDGTVSNELGIDKFFDK